MVALLTETLRTSAILKLWTAACTSTRGAMKYLFREKRKSSHFTLDDGFRANENFAEMSVKTTSINFKSCLTYINSFCIGKSLWDRIFTLLRTIQRKKNRYFCTDLKSEFAHSFLIPHPSHQFFFYTVILPSVVIDLLCILKLKIVLRPFFFFFKVVDYCYARSVLFLFLMCV